MSQEKQDFVTFQEFLKAICPYNEDFTKYLLDREEDEFSTFVEVEHELAQFFAQMLVNVNRNKEIRRDLKRESKF